MIAETPLIESTKTARSARARRFGSLYLILAVSFVVLAGRSFYLQVVHGAHFRTTAEGNRVTAQLKPAPRGIIYDRNGTQLVENVASTDIVVNPAQLPTRENESILIERLPKLLSLSAPDIQTALNETRQTQRPTRLKAAVDHETLLAIERELPQLPGIELVSSLVRQYPHGYLEPHVLGYTSPVSAQELESRENVVPTDITGKAGLERFYDEQLRGRHGARYVEVNANGTPIKQLAEYDSVPGQDLHLSLDSELQSRIMDILSEYQEEHSEKTDRPLSGAVIALDPRSGAIRALVSYPSYDPNIFSQPHLNDQTTNIIKQEQQPLFNRAISGTYPPGSTIKPLIASAALEKGVITPTTTVLSTGGINVGPWSFPDWKGGGHGVTNVTKAIAESVNTFFYTIAGGYNEQPGLGVERLTEELRRFNWGQPTGIDVPQEADGFLPSPEWKEETKGERWYIGDTYHLGIGQGDILATPIQIASATSTIANGGTVYQPSLVAARTAPDDTSTTHHPKSHASGFSQQTIQTVQGGMRETVNGTSGSARSLNTMGIPLAGKTGTAQVGGTDDTHAWFTSYGPYNNPELVITILIEYGGGGDTTAVPLARKIWEWWIDNRVSSNE